MTSDPRETLAHGTLTHVYTTPLEETTGIYAKTTYTPLDQDRLIPDQGLYRPVSQDPTTEGEVVVLYSVIYGIDVAQIFVAADVGGGALEWKAIEQSNGPGGNTGGADI